MNKRKVDLIRMRMETGIPIEDIIKALKVPMPSDKELLAELNNPDIKLDRVVKIILFPLSSSVKKIALQKFEHLLSARMRFIDRKQSDHIYYSLPYESKAKEIFIRVYSNFYLNDFKVRCASYLKSKDELEGVLRSGHLDYTTHKKIEGIIVKFLIDRIRKDLNDPLKPIEYFWYIFNLDKWPHKFEEILARVKAGLIKIYQERLPIRIALLTESEIVYLFNEVNDQNFIADEWFKNVLKMRIIKICHSYLEKDCLPYRMEKIILSFHNKLPKEFFTKLQEFINRRFLEKIDNPIYIEQLFEIYQHPLCNRRVKKLAIKYINILWRAQLRNMRISNKIDERKVKEILLNEDIYSSLTRKMAIRTLAELYTINS